MKHIDTSPGEDDDVYNIRGTSFKKFWANDTLPEFLNMFHLSTQ